MTLDPWGFAFSVPFAPIILLVSKGASKHNKARESSYYIATGPNQVWSWDITYLRSALRGQFYYLNLVVDVWSQKIVAWRWQLGKAAKLRDDDLVGKPAEWRRSGSSGRSTRTTGAR